MWLTRHLDPHRRVYCRKEGIAGKVSVDFGDDQSGSQRQRISVDLRTANDKHLAIASQIGRLLQRAGGIDALMLPVRIACDDDIAPVGERPSYGFKSLPAHQDGMASRRAFEKRQILRQSPGEGVVDADAVVALSGNNQGEGSGHDRRMIVDAGALHRDRCFDRGMRLVADDLDIVELVIKNCGGLAFQNQFRQGQWLARQLFAHLIHMV